MILGPVFHRELRLAPRRPRVYWARATYGIALLVLACTMWQLLSGTQRVRDPGDFARLGSMLFGLLAPLQVIVATFFAGILAAAAVAQEKDRHTLDLLLMTRMNASELVVGKMMSSLLTLLMLMMTALPIFLFVTLFGGVSTAQVGVAMGATLAGILVSGSLGSTLALWREKTFQALAMTLFGLLLWLGLGRLCALGMFGTMIAGVPAEQFAVIVSPLEAVLYVCRPYADLLPGVRDLFTGASAAEWTGTLLTETSDATGVSRVFTHVPPTVLLSGFAVVLCVLINGIAMFRVRYWNTAHDAQRFRREDETWNRPSIWSADHQEAPQTIAELEASQRENPREPSQERNAYGIKSEPLASATTRAAGTRGTVRRPYRHVWDNPILWREIRTWAYGRRILVVRLVFLLFFAVAVWRLASLPGIGASVFGGGADAGLKVAQNVAMTVTPIFLLAIVLVNAQAVTSITGERDAKSLDLLLVSDLTPKEILWGKLGGIFYNTREMWGLPLLLCVGLGVIGQISVENTICMVIDLILLFFFVAVLGVHIGMTYESSAGATATSLGTVFFLFLGVATCMWMMILFSGSFETQLQSFLAFMVGGGLGLYIALGARNPSPAIGIASLIAPLATFYAITSLLLGQTMSVFLVIAATYGFATAAMLVPALYEFDVATGRTTISEL
ncbi:MAG: ABC transporter permease subunit [Planctomycetia bacterium]|nr:ABC transporter permease subunit [Planctomycetia bacterium]